MTNQATPRSTSFVAGIVLVIVAALGGVAVASPQAATETSSKDEAELTQARAAHDLKAEASALYALGSVYKSIGQLQKALEFFNQALPLQREGKNRTDEADSLTAIGETYNGMGQPNKALESLNQALTIQRETKNQAGEATTLTAIAEVYNGMGQPKKALDLLNQALPMQRAAANRKGEGTALNDIGEVYWALGESQKSLEFYNQALPIEREVKDRAGEAVTLSDIGSYYWAVGQPEKALEYYNQAIPIERELGDRSDEAVTLHATGSAYQDVGELQTALEYYSQALPIEREVGNRSNEAITLHAIGSVYQDIGESKKALEYYNQALPIEQEAGDQRSKATTLSNVAGAYKELGQSQKAIDSFKEALAIQQRVGDRRAEAITLHDLGATYQDMGQQQQAVTFYKQALPIEREVGDKISEGFTFWRMASLGDNPLRDYLFSLELAKGVGDLNLEGLINTSLMRYCRAQKQLNVAIFYGKEAVNEYQQIRGHMTGLERTVQDSFVQSRAATYRELAKLLIDKGQIPEAEHVIGMLKEEEYSEFTRGDGSVTPPGQPLPLTKSELEAQSITADELKWISLSVSDPTDKETAVLEAKLSAENDRFTEAIQKTLIDKAQQKGVMSSVMTMQNILNQVQQRSPQTVGVVTLVLDKELDLIVVTKNLTVAPRVVHISREDLDDKVEELRRQLQNPCSDPHVASEDLYKVVMAPILADLKGADAKTILWELDGALRYIPIGALYDGKHYVAENFGSVLYTSTHPDALVANVDLKDWQALGMGVSQARLGLPDLIAVPKELESIIHDPADDSSSHGPLPGKILLNDKFTPTAMKQEIRTGFPIVHIASHFVLEPGSDQASYLLLGTGDEAQGGRLTLAELHGVGYRFDRIQLLTLSACETGTSGGTRDDDGEEIEGLGDLAEDKGAKSVLATLWNVSDASTGQFMTDFYQRWTGAGSSVQKVEALRLAQVDMINSGNVDATRNACKNSHTTVTWGHPFYWAPFILIGNWQ